MEPKDRQNPPDAGAHHRAYVPEHVVHGGLTIDQAAAILKLSTRQVDRLLARYRDGPASKLPLATRIATGNETNALRLKNLTIDSLPSERSNVQ